MGQTNRGGSMEAIWVDHNIDRLEVRAVIGQERPAFQARFCVPEPRDPT